MCKNTQKKISIHEGALQASQLERASNLLYL